MVLRDDTDFAKLPVQRVVDAGAFARKHGGRGGRSDRREGAARKGGDGAGEGTERAHWGDGQSGRGRENDGGFTSAARSLAQKNGEQECTAGSKRNAEYGGLRAGSKERGGEEGWAAAEERGERGGEGGGRRVRGVGFGCWSSTWVGGWVGAVRRGCGTSLGA
jgi:hypothetical protein